MNETSPMTRDDDSLRLLRASVRTLFERSGGVARARKIRDESYGWDTEMIGELADAGVFAVAAPEAAGGLGLGLSAAGVIAEEAGRVLAPEPIAPSIGLSIGLLHRLCPDHPLLADALAGGLVLATAWQERGANGVSDEMSCRIQDGALTGEKSWVVGVDGTSALLVVAEGENGPALVAVEPGARGVSIERRRQSDGSHLTELAFSQAPAQVLKEGQAVSDALDAAVSNATALGAAELVGLSEQALNITLDFIKTREQFDKPIAAFQVIQHRAVDLFIRQEVSATGVREALALMDASTDPRARARQASRAKARACSTAKMITRGAIQLHGAVGYTNEFDIGLFLNRALALSAWLGDDAHHRREWLKVRDEEEGVK